MKYLEKKCKVHGHTSFVLEARGYYRCRKCRSEAVSKRRRNVKKLAVEYKGGKCQQCGYAKCIAALEFHHLHGKDFAIAGDGVTLSWNRVKAELEKCILVCANCHREIHAQESLFQDSSAVEPPVVTRLVGSSNLSPGANHDCPK